MGLERGLPILRALLEESLRKTGAMEVVLPKDGLPSPSCAPSEPVLRQKT